MKTNDEKAAFWANEIFRALSKRALESISPSDWAATKTTIAELLNENSVETIRMLAHDGQADRDHLLAAGRCGTDSLETEIVNLRNRQHNRDQKEREREMDRKSAMESGSKRK